MTLARLATLSAAAMIAAGPVFAAGSDDDTPPTKTETTTECTDGQIFDEKTQTCLDATEQSFNDTDRYEAARELAYAGRIDDAMVVLAAAQDQNDPRILNYKGFTQRKLGNMDAAMAFYEQALAIDPDYILARSYMGQGLVTMGDEAGARAQLVEIAARGGKDSWAYASLENAMAGQQTSY